MSRVSMKQLLQDAAKNKYAVPCFNAINLDMVRGIIEAAEEEQSPVILCHAEVHFKYTPIEEVAPILTRAMDKSKVPVSVLLDHGKSLSSVIKALRLGFNAVMFDGSKLPYEENVRQTAEVVKIASEFGASVEGELGYVTRPRGGGAEGEDDNAVIDDPTYYTDPVQVSEFVERTGVDALAVAFGTVHGVYLKKPKLDIGRLSRIKAESDVPLVMHGGSGLSEGEYRRCIDNGISKINYYTNMALDVGENLRNKLVNADHHLYYHHLMLSTIDEFRESARKIMRVFRSHHKA